MEITISAESLTDDGKIEIVTLDSEGVPLGSMVMNAADVVPVPSQDGGGLPVLLWILIGIGGLGGAGLAAYLVWKGKTA